LIQQCGNPAKVNEIEADSKDAGLKRSTNISAKRRIGLKWQKIALSGSTWRRPSSCSGLQMDANDDDDDHGSLRWLTLQTWNALSSQ